MKSLPFATHIARIALVLLLLPGALLAAQNPDSAAISSLLQSVKAHAAAADDDSATLAAYARSGMDKKHHGLKLNRIREHVNRLIVDSNELNSIRHEGSPWQQQAIDRITGLLPEMADHLTATINHLNEHPSHTNLQPFRDYVFNNERLIHNAHEIISDYVEYGEAKAKTEALEKELAVPADASNPGV
jgi:hypothetical protein